MPGVAGCTNKTVLDVLKWQAGLKTPRLPNQCSSHSEEKKLGLRFAKLLLRRFDSLSNGADRKRLPQLSKAEIALVNSVPGVPESGCASSAAAQTNVHYAAAAETMALYASSTAMNLSASSQTASSAAALAGAESAGQKRYLPQEAAYVEAAAHNKRRRYKQKGAQSRMPEKQTG